jgi:hypothetical protein
VDDDHVSESVCDSRILPTAQLTECRGNMPESNIFAIGQTAVRRSQVCGSIKLICFIRIENHGSGAFDKSSSFIVSRYSGMALEKRRAINEAKCQSTEMGGKQATDHMQTGGN